MHTAAWLKEHANHLVFATVKNSQSVSTPARQRQGGRSGTCKGSACSGTTETLSDLSRADPEPCALLTALKCTPLAPCLFLA